MIEYLASQPSFDAEVGCPVYYAVHFRNLPGLQSLLERSSQASLKECVFQLDAHNETAVHTSARSKSSGFTRLFVSIANAAEAAAAAGKAAPDSPALKLLGASLPEVSTEQGVLYSASSLTESLSTADLELLVKHCGKSGRKTQPSCDLYLYLNVLERTTGGRFVLWSDGGRGRGRRREATRVVSSLDKQRSRSLLCLRALYNRCHYHCREGDDSREGV